MSSSPSSELLSAYLDGELCATERSALEQQLSENPALREELEELQALARRIQSLPRAKAPDGLAGLVLQQIDLQSPRPQVSPRPAPNVWLRRLTVISTCLGVGVIVWLIQPSKESDRLVHSPVSTTSSVADTALPAAPIVAMGSMEIAELASADVVGLEADETLKDLVKNGRGLQSGELLSYLDQKDGEPVVVEYVVADIDRAFGEVQVLLSKNGIRALSDGKLVPPEAGEQRVVAIYVEADEQQVASFVDEVQQQRSYVSMNIANPELDQFPILAKKLSEFENLTAPQQPVSNEDKFVAGASRMSIPSAVKPKAGNAPASRPSDPADRESAPPAAASLEQRAVEEAIQVQIDDGSNLKKRLSSRQQANYLSTVNGNSLGREATENVAQQSRQLGGGSALDTRCRVILLLEADMPLPGSPDSSGK